MKRTINQRLARFASISMLGFLFYLWMQTNFPKQLYNRLDPDFSITDTYYKMGNTVPFDEKIVLVDIGHYNRQKIADLVDSINGSAPAVIGVDAIFTGPDTTGSFALKQAFSQVKNLVLAEDLNIDSTDKKRFEAKEQFYSGLKAEIGFVNVDAPGGMLRRFAPFDYSGQTEKTFFSVKVAGLYDPKSKLAIKERGKDREEVFYTGKTQSDDQTGLETGNPFTFKSATYEEAIELAENKFFKDKIVLLGFLGGTDVALQGKSTDIGDKFYSPMRPSEETDLRRPDIYGVTVHANIVKMILEGNYVQRMSKEMDWLAYGFIAFCCFLLWGWVLGNTGLRPWFFVLSVVVLLSGALLIEFLAVYLFSEYRFAINGELIAYALFYPPLLAKIVFSDLPYVFGRSKIAAA